MKLIIKLKKWNKNLSVDVDVLKKMNKVAMNKRLQLNSNNNLNKLKKIKINKMILRNNKTKIRILKFHLIAHKKKYKN